MIAYADELLHFKFSERKPSWFISTTGPLTGRLKLDQGRLSSEQVGLKPKQVGLSPLASPHFNQ